MRRHRNVKIVATLGPSSETYEMIRALHEAGADVFRLNMSHGTHDGIREKHRIIRQIEEELNSPIGILADLQGPKLRVGAFAKGEEELEEGASFRLDLDGAEGDGARVGRRDAPPARGAALRPVAGRGDGPPRRPVPRRRPHGLGHDERFVRELVQLQVALEALLAHALLLLRGAQGPPLVARSSLTRRVSGGQALRTPWRRRLRCAARIFDRVRWLRISSRSISR